MLSVSYWKEHYWGGANRIKKLCFRNHPKVVYFKGSHAREWDDPRLVRLILRRLWLV